jgi:hypothetical protein
MPVQGAGNARLEEERSRQMLRSIGCKLAIGLAGVALASASAAADGYVGRGSYGYMPPGAYGYAPPAAYGYAPPAAYGYTPPAAYGYAPPGAYGYAPPGAYGYAPPAAYGYAPPAAYGYVPFPAYGYGPGTYNSYAYPPDRTPPSNPYYFGTEAWWHERDQQGAN